MKRLIKYFQEAWAELGRISWPNRQQTIRLTTSVIIFSTILSIFIGLIDIGLVKVVEKVLL